MAMIKKKMVLQAVKTLRDINKKYYEDSSKKKLLLEDEGEATLYLQVTLKKIPNNKLIKMIKVNLPHRILKDSSEVCLIAGDLDKKNRKAEIEPDVLHYKEMLEKHEITNISEVLTLRQLRTEYKPYEAKQKLLAAYDVFLVDNRITECLPKILGRHFFKKRKFPIQINLKTPNLKQQIEKALLKTVFYVTGHGNSCISEVAHLDMNDSDISDNIVAMTKVLEDQLPGSWDNVMGMYLKTSLSKAIPLYMSYDDPSKVELEEEEEDVSAEIDELSTMDGINVKVYKDGRIETFSIKTRLETEANEINDADEIETVDSDEESTCAENSNEIIGTELSFVPDELSEDNITAMDTKKDFKPKKKKKIQNYAVEKEIISEEDADEIETVDSDEESTCAENSNKVVGTKLSFVADELSEDNITAVDTKKDFKPKKKKKIQNYAVEKEIISEEDPENSKTLKKQSKKQKADKKNALLESVLTVTKNSASITDKSRTTRKSKKQLLTDHSSEKNEPTETIKKSKTKRKREESMLMDEVNKSRTNTPVQIVKKRKMEEVDMKKCNTKKENKKGKRDKRRLCK